VIGESEAVRALKSLLARIATSPARSVLLLGESGTGKGLIAEEIHRHSGRHDRLFQHICCSALPETLLESELFGHEAGAFTDAKRRKKGLVEVADGGTLFLDEIGEVSVGLQVKLLRFLEEQRFKRVGGTEDLEVDVRIVTATNKDLGRCVAEGSFRQDLYYRLSTLPVLVLPLRERLDDVPLLIDHFVAQFNGRYGMQVTAISDDAREALLAYHWPGNVRELKNLIERAMLLTTDDRLDPMDFVTIGEPLQAPPTFVLPPGGIDLEELEADLLHQALERTDGNQTRAAELLGLTRHQIHYRMRKHRLPGGGH
jgi:transcriptional regulator with PAS, ATPase and Fis domain